MNVYCEAKIQDAYEKNTEDFQPELKERTEVMAPVFSMEKLYKDYNIMCSRWNLQIDLHANKRGIKNLLKTVLKKTVLKLTGWMLQPNLECQSEYNLSMVHLMGDLLRAVDYMDGQNQKSQQKPELIICRDSIAKESRLQEILLIFQYYQLFVEPNAALIFLSEQMQDHLYFELLQRTISELQLRTVQFVITEDTGIQNDYLKKSDVEISLAEKETIEAAQVPLLQYSAEKITKESVYVFDEIDMANIAVLIKTVIDDGKNQ